MKQVTICVHERFWQIHVLQNKQKKQQQKQQKTYFRKSCLQCFSSKNVLTKHKEVCLRINVAQFVRLEKGTIEFKNYFKQIPVPSKIYAYFESNLNSVESYKGSYSKTYQDRIPCAFVYKLVCVDSKFSKPIFCYRGEYAVMNLLKQLLRSMNTIKEWQKWSQQKFDHYRRSRTTAISIN